MLRQQIEYKNPRLKRRIQPRKKKRRVQTVVLPIIEGEDREFYRDSDEARAGDENHSSSAEGRFDPQNYSLFSVLHPPHTGNPSIDESSSQIEQSLSDDETSPSVRSSLFNSLIAPSSLDKVSKEIDEITATAATFDFTNLGESSIDGSAEPDGERTSLFTSDSDCEQKLPSCSSGDPCRDRQPIWKRIGHNNLDSDSDEASEKQGKRQHSNSQPLRYVASRYSKYMVCNIKKLPLPNALKKFVNYDREL